MLLTPPCHVITFSVNGLLSCDWLSGGREDVGLHSASNGGGDPDEEEEEERLRFPEAPGQGPPHTAEEPIKHLVASKDLQLQTSERLIGCWTGVFTWKQEAD